MEDQVYTDIAIWLREFNRTGLKQMRTYEVVDGLIEQFAKTNPDFNAMSVRELASDNGDYIGDRYLPKYAPGPTWDQGCANPRCHCHS